MWDKTAAGFSYVKDKLDASTIDKIDISVRRTPQSHEIRVARVEVQAAKIELRLNSSDVEDLKNALPWFKKSLWIERALINFTQDSLEYLRNVFRNDEPLYRHCKGINNVFIPAY